LERAQVRPATLLSQPSRSMASDKTVVAITNDERSSVDPTTPSGTRQRSAGTHLSDACGEARIRCDITSTPQENPMLVTPIFLLTAAAPPTISAIAGDAADASSSEVRAVESPTAPDAANFLFADFASDLQTPTVVVMPPPQPPQPPPLRQRFTVKGGYFNANEDEFDDGSNWILSWIRPMSKFLASEVELGYLDVGGSNNGVVRDAWALTFMANARLTFPVAKKFEIYGGVGLGTFYYDAKTKIGGVSASTDGFLLAGDGYFGASVHVGEKLTVGVEGKYYVTDDISNLGDGLNGFAAMLTVGFDI
jgi:opacity protein-like surface antigen